ncbi:MAG TPA: bifunctional 4-hydroxy-2-oxoglutarate aldolase/2-dehydro-3-deoxy-phosphogluconate aldolase [Chthoniobacterales bacterium]|jgi:2-dehydro-3-deoxyphosphogluconate aldolase/(4S)-4-hydroxy-2-oxoglutarate aldolase|nr:bifunctional 4-hydroxy-2-oxoglutarate aldolase/2-dehydro-3-deoxy-phosphogluconate aldolase [Chthoniobacterales bacterium]
MKRATASIDKAAVVERIKRERAVAVIRTDSIERALSASNAAVAGGFRAIEITFSFPEASKAIAQLAQSNERDLLIGAGTILTREHVHEAVKAGALFLVSPCVLPEVLDAARELQVAIIPGAFTPTEIYTAHSLGADIVKIFPAVKFGPEYLKAIRGPLPNIPIMPTSGVDASNVAEWFKAGAVAVGAVGTVFDPALIRNGDRDALTKRAWEFMDAVRAAR